MRTYGALGLAVAAWLLGGCAESIGTDPGWGAADGGDLTADGAPDRGRGDASTREAAAADAAADASVDANVSDVSVLDAAIVDATPRDASGSDGSVVDSGILVDSGGKDASTGGIVSGGPCMSGAQGATAFRIRFSNAGGRAQVNHEAHGLPDASRWRGAVYGYQIGFTPAFVDTFLGAGGLQLDSSDFIDVELSTANVSTIRSAYLAILGRSYATSSSGSFSWQTFKGSGATATNSVSNSAPYQWYVVDIMSSGAIIPNDANILLRIKAGPSSGSLVVNRVELCMDAS